MQQKQEKVRAVFTQLIGDEQDEPSPTDSQWQDFLEADFEDIEQILLESGISENNIDEVLEKLAQFKDSLNHRVIGSRGRDVLSHLMPTALALIFQKENYRTLLPRILNIIEKNFESHDLFRIIIGKSSRTSASY